MFASVHQNMSYKRCFNLTSRFKLHFATPIKVSVAISPYSTKTHCAAWNVLFFGTDDFSAESLEVLCHELKLATLISRLEIVTSMKSHKPNAVQRIAAREKLTVHSWPLHSVPQGFHVGLVASFGHLIPKRIIDDFPLGVLNVHASLLPRWRGASPIVHAILNGDTETGVSIMQIKPHRFDVGPVLKQLNCPIGLHETTADVQSRLARLGATALLDVVRRLPESLEDSVPQLECGVTYAPKVTPALHCVVWNKMTGTEVYNLWRALGYVSSQWHGDTIRLMQATAPQHMPETPSHGLYCQSTAVSRSSRKVKHSGVPPKSEATPGTIHMVKSSPVLNVVCADKTWVGFSRIILPRRKPMSAIDFYNGFLTKRPSDEWFFVQPSGRDQK